MAPWGDPGVTEQQMILEDSIICPGQSGGVKTQTLQRAGYLKKLRIMAEAEIEQTVATNAPAISPYGGFAGLVRLASRAEMDFAGVFADGPGRFAGEHDLRAGMALWVQLAGFHHRDDFDGDSGARN